MAIAPSLSSPVPAASAPAPTPTAGRAPVVLIVDDERALRDTLAYNLRRAGFEPRTAADGAAAMAAARAESPDLILLDVLLPGGTDGFEVCRRLRPSLRCPIILLSALSDEIDRVVGLEVGADDYITKPFSTTELVARIKAHLRRAGMREVATRAVQPGGEAPLRPPASPPIVIGDLQVDPLRREARLLGRPVRLKRREFDLLYYLARHAGITVSRSRLLDAVWPEEVPAGPETRTVDVHVHRLRDRIEPSPKKPRYLHTVRGFGYVLRAPVEATTGRGHHSGPAGTPAES